MRAHMETTRQGSAAASTLQPSPHGVSVRLESLHKTFGPVTAVDAVTLTIQAGEFVTLLGPSGSGKTTTLMMVAGFQTPSAGEIWLGDRPVSRLPPHRRSLGVVFQNYALFPHLTVYDNLAFPLRMRGVPRDVVARRVVEVLDLVKLPGYGRRYPHQLSGGQQQRVALARALVFRPGVVLMDEPLGALDKQLRDHMQLELKQLQRSIGMTVIYVTHDQSEALAMSDRLVVMAQGRIEQVGRPEYVYERPATRFVASFLGESNFLDGRVVQASGRRDLVILAAGLRVAVASPMPYRVGTRITLMIRPEKIMIDTRDAPLDNTFSAMVDEVVYAGDHAKCRLRVVGDPRVELVAKRPIRHGLASLTPGQLVQIGWSAADAQVIPDTAAAAPDAGSPGPPSPAAPEAPC